MANIVEEILFELGRRDRLNLKLTPKIDARVRDGYPEDLVSVVWSSDRDLKLDSAEVGFEKD